MFWNRKVKTMFEPIGLGDRVRDPISGYAGIVTAESLWLHGCIRDEVTAEALHEGKPIQPSHFDQSQLDLVERAVHQPKTMTGGGIADLGDRVRCLVTGAEGIVVVVTTHLHGPKRLGVQSETVKDGKPLVDHYFDREQLQVLVKRVHAPMAMTVAEAPKPTTRRSNGGPAREGAGFRRA